MYLVGMMGQNMIYNIIGTGLYFYFQSVIFIPAMAISIFMAVARVWDAINDPMMGTFVDRTNTKWGKCRPYLLFSPVVIMVITILTFCNGMYGSANTRQECSDCGLGCRVLYPVGYVLHGRGYSLVGRDLPYD